MENLRYAFDDPRNRIIAIVAFVVILAAIVVAAVFLTNRELTPLDTTSAFMNAVNNGDANSAVEYVCGTIAVPALPVKGFMRNLKYESINQTDVDAKVWVTGEVFLSAPVGAVKQEINYTAILEKRPQSWCINKDSINDFLGSLTTIK